MSDLVDVIVVGSGPSGAQAAKAAVDAGLRVTMIDYGNDAVAQERVPSGTFADLRRLDVNQREYFLGKEFQEETNRNDRLGAHFTAPRTFITQDVSALLPVESESFFPVQSLALGGLGAGWGAGSPTFEPFELERAGLSPEEIAREYAAVAADIGVSGATEDDTAGCVLRIPNPQPASEIDSNAASILAAYSARRESLNEQRFSLGRAPLALLTQPLSAVNSERYANPYTDMDFYGTSLRSVYRPKYTVYDLLSNELFRYVSRALVETFKEDANGVAVCFTGADGSRCSMRAKKLVLAAGAINSARIAARSLGLYGVRFPVVCNPMNYIACLNLRMLGKPAEERRHSLAQLLALYTPAHRDGDHVMAAIYSYRSLLHYRLVKDLPMPPSLGVIVTRALMTCLTLVGVHHPDRASSRKWLELQQTATGDVLRAHYELDKSEAASVRADISGLKRCLRAIGCLPVSVFSTESGSSIHYGGTMPATNNAEHPLTCDDRGKLHRHQHVYAADSSAWTYLPAKGLTLTLMANARRVARNVARELSESGLTS